MGGWLTSSGLGLDSLRVYCEREDLCRLKGSTLFGMLLAKLVNVFLNMHLHLQCGSSLNCMGDFLDVCIL